MKNKIIINESFLDKKLTGIPRFGYEISSRLLDYDNVYLLSTKNKHDFIKEKVLTIGKGNQSFKITNLVNKQIYINNINRNDKLLHLGSLLPIKKENMFITICDMSVFDHPEWFKASFVLQNKILIPTIVKYATNIITISKFSKERIIKHLKINEKKIIVLPCGVSKIFSPQTEESVKKIRKKYNLPVHYILFLSSLEPRKNLLKAWSYLDKTKKKGYNLVIAGSKGKVFSKTNIEDKIINTSDIIFTGYFDDKELPALYTGARGFIYPSFYEGFGIPPLEAMACGTPVIVSNAASLPEVVGKSAIFIHPNNIQSIIEGIQLIIEDSAKCKELSRQGILQSEIFSWEKSSAMLYDILNK